MLLAGLVMGQQGCVCGAIGGFCHQSFSQDFTLTADLECSDSVVYIRIEKMPYIANLTHILSSRK